jgi:hypothetical protein
MRWLVPHPLTGASSRRQGTVQRLAGARRGDESPDGVTLPQRRARPPRRTVALGLGRQQSRVGEITGARTATCSRGEGGPLHEPDHTPTGTGGERWGCGGFRVTPRPRGDPTAPGPARAERRPPGRVETCLRRRSARETYRSSDMLSEVPGGRSHTLAPMRGAGRRCPLFVLPSCAEPPETGRRPWTKRRRHSSLIPA